MSIFLCDMHLTDNIIFKYAFHGMDSSLSPDVLNFFLKVHIIILHKHKLSSNVHFQKLSNKNIFNLRFNVFHVIESVFW